MKILFVATYPNIATGYSRVANKLSNYMASLPNTELYYYGMSNSKDERKISRSYHPNIHLIDVIAEEKKAGISEEHFGKDLICDYMRKIQPDVLFIYNDLIVACNLFNSLLEVKNTLKYKTILYLDIVYNCQRPEFLNHADKNIDMFLVFSEYWKKELIFMGMKKPIDVLHHGADTSLFFPVPKMDARKVFGIGEKDFVILNANRNCYRKGNDVGIRAFLKFLKRHGCPSNIKLFLTCPLYTKSGFDLLTLTECECHRENIPAQQIIQTNILQPNPNTTMDDKMMNILYSVCDVGINTCFGEGFGLCNFEHALVGKPQIVSNVGGLRDIFREEFSIKINPVAEIYVPRNLEEHSGILHIVQPEPFVEALDDYYKNIAKRLEHGEWGRRYLLEKYCNGNGWTDVYTKLSEIIDKL